MADKQARVGRWQRWLEARWYGNAPVPFWLGWLTRVYGIASRWRRQRSQVKAKAQILPVPVVVVGNITVGGSGKTPVVIALIDALRAAGFRPGVISRGYGRSSSCVSEVVADGDPVKYGDEPVLIKQRTGVPVVVGRDRAAAGELLLSHHAIDVIVSDDGLQHYRLARDIEIAIVDGRRRFGNGRLLPAGPLREPVSRLDECDLVLINGQREADELGFDLIVGQAHALDSSVQRPLESFVGSAVHAVAGIGDPQRFFIALRSRGLEIIEHPFPDHHAFVPSDFAFAGGRPVLMTEKDAVKCRTFARSGWYRVPVELALPDDVVGEIFKKLANP